MGTGQTMPQALPDFQTLEKAIIWKAWDHVTDLSDEGLARNKLKYRRWAGFFALIVCVAFLIFAFGDFGEFNQMRGFMLFFTIFTGLIPLFAIGSMYRDDVTDNERYRPLIDTDPLETVGGDNLQQYHEYQALTPQYYLYKAFWFLRHHLKDPGPFMHPQKHDLAVYPLDLLVSASANPYQSQWSITLRFKAPSTEDAEKVHDVGVMVEKEQVIQFFRTLKSVYPSAPISSEIPNL